MADQQQAQFRPSFPKSIPIEQYDSIRLLQAGGLVGYDVDHVLSGVANQLETHQALNVIAADRSLSSIFGEVNAAVGFSEPDFELGASNSDSIFVVDPGFDEDDEALIMQLAAKMLRKSSKK